MTSTSRFITSENTTVTQAFFDALAADKDLGATRGIDATLHAFQLDALLLPTDISSTPAAIAGYPIITGKCRSPPSFHSIMRRGSARGRCHRHRDAAMPDLPYLRLP